MHDPTPFYSRDGIKVHSKVFRYMLDNPDCKIQWSNDGVKWYSAPEPTFDPNTQYRVAPKVTKVQYHVYELFDIDAQEFYDHLVVSEEELSFLEAWDKSRFEVKKVSSFTKTETKEINL